MLLAYGCISDENAATEELSDSISQMNGTSIIPRELLFGNPDKTTALLSPDGTRISYIVGYDQYSRDVCLRCGYRRSVKPYFII